VFVSSGRVGDLLVAIAALILGVTFISLGAWGYAAKDEESFLRHPWSTVFWLNTPWTMAMLPVGFGSILLGVAFIVGKNAITTDMVVIGLAAFVVGWVLFFVHPRWLVPRGMRRRKR
jgi:hypothetical protein